MTCPRCQRENPPQAKFCNACGARLAAICPNCSHQNSPGSHFCNECGQPLESAVTSASPRLYTPKHLGLGKLYRRTGKREQAQEHLRTAATMYREMDMRFWLDQVDAELAARSWRSCSATS